MKKNVIIIALLNSVFLFSQRRNLRNIQQLTDGGDNAEAYFSPKWKEFLTMQVTNKNLGAECDQIFAYDLSKDYSKKSDNLQLISLGKRKNHLFFLYAR
ncbi:MAG: hypothetical protein U0T78_06495 [Cloacibacterium normanense]